MADDLTNKKYPPKVLASYSWTSVEHKDHVRRYAERFFCTSECIKGGLEHEIKAL